MGFTFFAGFSGFLMNSFIVLKLCLRRKSKDNGIVSDGGTKDSETKLLVFSVAIFLAFSLTLAIQVRRILKLIRIGKFELSQPL